MLLHTPMNLAMLGTSSSILNHFSVNLKPQFAAKKPAKRKPSLACLDWEKVHVFTILPQPCFYHSIAVLCIIFSVMGVHYWLHNTAEHHAAKASLWHCWKKAVKNSILPWPCLVLQSSLVHFLSYHKPLATDDQPIFTHAKDLALTFFKGSCPKFQSCNPALPQKQPLNSRFGDGFFLSLNTTSCSHMGQTKIFTQTKNQKQLLRAAWFMNFSIILDNTASNIQQQKKKKPCLTPSS